MSAAVAHAAVVRRATLDDAPALTRYYRAVVLERLPTISRRAPLTLAEQQQWLGKRVEGDDRLVFIAVVGDDIVGMLDATRGGGQRTHSAEFGVSVAAEHRGHGLGSRLIRTVLAWADGQAWIERLGLDVLANNPRAIGLYQRHGFVQEGIRRRAWLVDDVAIDLVQMGLLRANGSFVRSQ